MILKNIKKIMNFYEIIGVYFGMLFFISFIIQTGVKKDFLIGLICMVSFLVFLFFMLCSDRFLDFMNNLKETE